MKNEWILDVLADLKAFSKANGLPALAEQLEDTALVAATELASAEEGVTVDDQRDESAARQDPRGFGGRL